ncbi:hypothetical protein TRIP_B200239 [uncultured Desulfatiglans sp.]|nr:hypothetical protein TRIP_B200239 [uncultured Desulfatiglans sp.]
MSRAAYRKKRSWTLLVPVSWLNKYQQNRRLSSLHGRGKTANIDKWSQGHGSARGKGPLKAAFFQLEWGENSDGNMMP